MGQPSSAEVLRSLGLDALVEMIETIGYGVVVTGDDHTWVYLNPAAAEMVGAPFEELHGRDYLLQFAEHERAALLALEYKQREGDTGFYTNTVVHPDGSELEMTWSGTVIEVDGVELAPAMMHETTTVRQAQREAAELGAAAVRLAEGRSTSDVLTALVTEAVAATRASAAVLLVEGGDGLLRVTASSGVPDRVAQAVAASQARLADLPAGELLRRGRAGFLSEDRRRLSENAVTSSWVEALEGIDWRGAAKVPVHRDGEVAGCLVVLLPERLTSPSESELAFWSSLAGQATVALDADRLRSEVFHASALMERQRIARDLHDSVNHALFGVQARAQAVRRALDRGNTELARAAAEDLELLSRQATTEMRELLAELRPAVDTTGQGLAEALSELTDSVTRRDGLPVELCLPPDGVPAVPTATCEHLVRIAAEALHNTVKHAAASSATVTVTVELDRLVLSVVDDGRGFDTAVLRATGHGQRNMRERAELLGGTVHVVSRAGGGTSVVAAVPLAA